MTQLSLEAALAGVAENNLTWIEWARAMAITCCHEWGSVTSDDIRHIADKTGYQPDSPHAWGALFKAPGWVCISRERSKYESNHGRFVCRWEWRGSSEHINWPLVNSKIVERFGVKGLRRIKSMAWKKINSNKGLAAGL